MTTVHALGDAGSALPPMAGATYVAVTKGVADGLVDLAHRVWTGEGTEPLAAGWRNRIADANERMAAEGMRVLGLAYRPLAPTPTAGRRRPRRPTWPPGPRSSSGSSSSWGWWACTTRHDPRRGPPSPRAARPGSAR
jgi:hypothetical protein